MTYISSCFKMTEFPYRWHFRHGSFPNKKDIHQLGMVNFRQMLHWKRCTPLKTNMTLENAHVKIGDTSSNGGFAIVMLVFGGVYTESAVCGNLYKV